MPSLDVTEKVDRVTQALSDKGFEDIYATHYDNMPSRMIVLHDDHGRLAHGECEAMTHLIEDSADVAEMWASLDDAGMIRTASLKRA